MRLPVISLVSLLALGGAASIGEAQAKSSTTGVPVRVIVRDPDDKAIPTAVVRHPQESLRHHVNAVDGSWEASILYLPDGTELVFTKGLAITLEISAPGYNTTVLQYEVKKRNNKIEVQLTPLTLDSEEIEEPVLQFGRDQPRDGGGAAPAN